MTVYVCMGIWKVIEDKFFGENSFDYVLLRLKPFFSKIFLCEQLLPQKVSVQLPP